LSECANREICKQAWHSEESKAKANLAGQAGFAGNPGVTIVAMVARQPSHPDHSSNRRNSGGNTFQVMSRLMVALVPCRLARSIEGGHHG
jgi:hypothetical protein